MKQVVVDASVILKWYLLDEAHGAQALALLQMAIRDRAPINSSPAKRF